MANNDYEIKYSNNKDSIIVKENHIDKSTTSLSLVGHGQPTYGVAQNTNFLHLLENFASNGTDNEPPPEHPVIGQIWFKNLGGGKFELNVCSDLSTSGEPTWSKMSQVITSASGSNYSDGDLYYDAGSKKLKVWDASQGGWISVGPTDIVHTEHVFNSFLVSPQTRAASYSGFSMSSISENIEETGGDKIGSGALNLVKMTIMAKEFKENRDDMVPSTTKCCVWLYKFVIRSVKTGSDAEGDIYTIDMVGSPSYELIAQNPADLDWQANIEFNYMTGDPQLFVNFVFNSIPANYVTIGIDTEITRM